MVTISVCMIVKNEENVLRRCLDSLKGIWDELIIVDTGSTDSTKEIAKEYTDKVYDFEWINDFSAARNFAMSKATMDYIYMADADEVLDEENHTRFLMLKEHLLKEIEIVEMWYVNQLANGTVYNYDRELRAKMYKRLREFTFIEPVHEMVRLDPVVFDSDIEIIHMPENLHAGRDFGIFERILAKDGQISERLLRMYALELLNNGTKEDFERAKNTFEWAVEKERSEDELRICFAVLTKLGEVTGNHSYMFKYATKDIALGASSEVCCILGMFYEKLGDMTEADIWYKNARFETEPLLSLAYKEILPK